MPCCKCCCEGGSPGGVCCGENCCKRPGVCCGGYFEDPVGGDIKIPFVCCQEGEFCCNGNCCPEGNNCCDGVCQSEPCDPPCDSPCDNCSDCIDGECVSRCAEGENCCDGNCLECCDDPDCPEGQVCVDGECVEAVCPHQECRFVKPDPGPYLVEKNIEVDCRDSTWVDQYFPCNRCIQWPDEGCGTDGQANAAVPPVYVPCNQVQDIPAEYLNCTCVILNSQCSVHALATGGDANGNGCTTSRTGLIFHSSVFAFDDQACQWVLVKKNDPVVNDYGCYSYACAQSAITGGCNAACPDLPSCDTECDGPFEGCDCNPLP